MDPVFILVALLAATTLLLLRSAVAAVTVAEYQQGLKYRNGRFAGLLGAGRHWIYRPSTTVELVDTRLSFVPIGGQEVVTSDGISVKLSLAVQMRVVDPVAAMHEVDSDHLATYTFVQVALRETVGALPIDDLLGNREAIGPEVLRRSIEPARAIGIELVGIDVKDLMFPGPLKRLFAQVIEARQQGLASLEKARGETAALRSLANAARLVDANPSLLQLRLLQQLESTSGNTIVLGMPSSATPLPLRTEPPTGGSALASGPDQSDPGERRS